MSKKKTFHITEVSARKYLDNKSIFNTSNENTQLIQFIPGRVVDVATSMQSAIYSHKGDINSIVAKPYIGNDLNLQSGNVKYYPLLRGIVDTPMKGDQVLLCSFGGVNYYLGPLNTDNSPNFNVDYMRADIGLTNVAELVGEQTSTQHSENFQAEDYARIQKIYNDKLDDPNSVSATYRDIHGDMLLEGRHGNSIRVGSRSNSPYVIISNGRRVGSIIESTTDGSIISITNQGTLADHFPFDGQLVDGSIVKQSFIISSDTIQDSDRLIGSEAYDYKYSDNQILATSNKITINSKGDLFVSAFSNVYIGAGDSVKIVSNRNAHITSKNIYLGEMALEQTEPIVLGNTLSDVLIDILDILKSVKMTACVAGLSGPPDPNTLSKIQTLSNKIKKDTAPFLSKSHFIESNN